MWICYITFLKWPNHKNGEQIGGHQESEKWVWLWKGSRQDLCGDGCSEPWLYHSASCLWCWVIVFKDRTIGGNWVKCTQHLSVSFLRMTRQPCLLLRGGRAPYPILSCPVVLRKAYGGRSGDEDGDSGQSKDTGGPGHQSAFLYLCLFSEWCDVLFWFAFPREHFECVN